MSVMEKCLSESPSVMLCLGRVNNYAGFIKGPWRVGQEDNLRWP